MHYAEKIKERIYMEASQNPVRAVIYARVSTDNEGQKDSCTNQVALAKNFIDRHQNISLIGTFVDEGISGKNDYNRPNYTAMLACIKTGQVDLIITKALSRLNRDQLNSLQLTSILLENNATVLTLEDGQIHDFEDMGAELLHSISFAIDAQYVKRQSINGRKTQELRCERKELSAKDISYGYDWDKTNKAIKINTNQTETVVYIFEEYVYRNGTPASIQKSLKAKGINLSSRTITNILQDERYIGHFYINKRTSKLGTGKTKSKRINLPKEDWVLVERPDLQTIDKELFDMAQRIRQTRQTIYVKADKNTVQAHFQGTHKFAGKIFCACCGKTYHFGYADRKNTIPIYRIRMHSDCESPINRLYEKDLEEITRIALKAALNCQSEVCTTLEQTLKECVEESNSMGTIEKLKKQKSSREKQIDGLIETLSEGGLTDASKQRIKAKINSIEEDIEKLSESITEMESIAIDDSFITRKISDIKKAIEDLRNFNSIDRKRILNYIERINIHGNGDVDMILKSGNVITFKLSNDNNNFPHEGNAVKTRIQDALYSWPAACPELLLNVLHPQ